MRAASQLMQQIAFEVSASGRPQITHLSQANNLNLLIVIVNLSNSLQFSYNIISKADGAYHKI
jgi:hypothetical protein